MVVNQPSINRVRRENIAKLLIQYDRSVYNHSLRVHAMCMDISNFLCLSEKEKIVLSYASLFHDVGKLFLSNQILKKISRLTNEEYDEIKKHPRNGAIILRAYGLERASGVVDSHHERYDGNGYPNGLKGSETDYLAKILCIVDSFDAMTTSRGYNEPKSYEEGVEELASNSGTQFDPEYTDAFIKLLIQKNSKVYY